MAGNVLEVWRWPLHSRVLLHGSEVLWVFLGHLGGCAQGRVSSAGKASIAEEGPVCPGAVSREGHLQAGGGDRERVPKGGCGPDTQRSWCGWVWRAVGARREYGEAGACLRLEHTKGRNQRPGFGHQQEAVGVAEWPRAMALGCEAWFPGTAILQGPEDGGRRGRG